MSNDPAQDALDRLFVGVFTPQEKTGDREKGTSPTVGGAYDITDSALASIGTLPGREIVGLRRRMWEANRQGQPLAVTAAYIDEKRFAALPTFSRRADDLLDEIIARCQPISETKALFTQDLDDPDQLLLRTIVCAESERDLFYFLKFIGERRFIEFNSHGHVTHVTVKPAALIHREAEPRDGVLGPRAFVAMWFNDATVQAWQAGIQPAIEDAGYEAFRIDRHEHVNRIDDEILAQIRTSRFLVADFTSEPEKPRGGVYFEAGFALGLDKPVIWTAHDSMLREIHSDTPQYNHIFWGNPAELRKRLYDRIVALLGVGPLKA